jgi:hypothetical protein
MKIKLHFNRINMQRGKDEVWTAHTSSKCEQTHLIVLRHNGQNIARTVFRPHAQQPRAYIELFGTLRRNGRENTSYIDDFDRSLPGGADGFGAAHHCDLEFDMREDR